MNQSASFMIQIADLNIEICGYNDEVNECFEGLKHIFCHHIVSADSAVIHRVVVCPSFRFVLPKHIVLHQVSTFIGVPGPRKHRLRFIFCKNKEIPSYSGTGEVKCYQDCLSGVCYYVPKDAEWRIGHNADEHTTYVYSDERNENADGLAAMLINVIGSQYGRYLLFSSCVAVDNNAVLLTGYGGAGKTTLCMRLINEGAVYMGDDLILVYIKDGCAMAGSLLLPVKHYTDSAHSPKRKTDIVSLLSQHPPFVLPIKQVYFLQRSSNDSEVKVEPVATATTFELMLDLTNKVHTYTDGNLFMNTLSEICNTVTCSMLSYGDCNRINLSVFC